MPGKIHNEQGFTLIELLIAMALIAILGSIAAISTGAIKRERLDSASRQLLADFQRARVDALTKTSSPNSRGFGLRFLANGSYTVFEFIDGDSDYTDSGGGEESKEFSNNLPSGVIATVGDDTTPAAGKVILFDKHGMARTTSWSSVGAGTTLVLRYPSIGLGRCVLVSSVRIREGTWNGSTCTIF